MVAVLGANALRIDGGHGCDTLRLNGAGDSFNFSVILPATVDSIEVMDLTGTGNNTLKLNAWDLFDFSDDTAGGPTTFAVHGGAGDTVTLSGLGWVADGNDGTFSLWINAKARIKIELDVGIPI